MRRSSPTPPQHGFNESAHEVPAQPDTEAAEVLRSILQAPLANASPSGAQIITGHLAGIDKEGRILFVAEQSDEPPTPVTIGVSLPDAALVPAARNFQRALVVRTSETPPRLVLLSLLRERIDSAARNAAPGQLELKVDGETLRLTAEREIELKCGNASLILRQSGRVILKGTHLVNSSRGPIKIKGATVDIN
jgi:hypothetical protein